MSNFWQQLKKPLIGLSPMDGVTDYPMRQIQVNISKPDVIYTEFVSVEGFVRHPEKFQKQLTFKDNEHPVIAQVFGIVPDDFEKAVKKIAKMGFAGIDINMGCPARTVNQRGGGGALIGNYDLAEKIINAALKGIKNSAKNIPLSVKTRIGIDKIVTKDWISFLAKFPLAEITVHGRLLLQNHGGPVNWEEIKLAAAIAHEENILLLGNGGIKSMKEAHEKSNQYSLDGVLIGQAALGNPWLFLDRAGSSLPCHSESPLGDEESTHCIYMPTKDEIFQTIQKHADSVWNFFGEKGFMTAKKHFCWYVKGLDNASDLRNKLVRVNNPDEVRKILSESTI